MVKPALSDDHQPRVCSRCASSSVDTARPFMASARSSLTSSNTLGSLKCVAACTIAFARFSASAGSANSVALFMKMAEPTKTASAPNCMTSDASAKQLAHAVADRCVQRAAQQGAAGRIRALLHLPLLVELRLFLGAPQRQQRKAARE